jgi:hypothetical protein
MIETAELKSPYDAAPGWEFALQPTRMDTVCAPAATAGRMPNSVRVSYAVPSAPV